VKKQLPLLLGLIVGFFAVIEFYVPHYYVGTVKNHLIEWTLVLAAGAYVIGAINILQVNLPKVRRRAPDWEYKIVLIVGAVAMALIGIKWHTFGGEPNLAITSTITKGAVAGDVAVVEVSSDELDALVNVGPTMARPLQSGAGSFEVPPGKHSIKLYMKAAGYTEVTGEVELAAGDRVVVTGSPTMQWGPSGRVFVWMYDHVFAPCNATMFALLAFFVASAAFRAFRARNAEALLLLVAAIVILIGRAPMGRSIHPLLPEVSDWILDIPNNAGRRAIMMGAAIGAIATGLRVILGLERSHLGSD